MNHWPYLPFLLVWALPVIGAQWLVGWRFLLMWRRRWPWIVFALGAYFTVADAVAIDAGTWRFDARALLGLYVGPVPVEEVLFYLLTATMVVQGVVVAWGMWQARDTLVPLWRSRLLRLSGNRRDAAAERATPRESSATSAPSQHKAPR